MFVSFGSPPGFTIKYYTATKCENLQLEFLTRCSGQIFYWIPYLRFCRPQTHGHLDLQAVDSDFFLRLSFRVAKNTKFPLLDICGFISTLPEIFLVYRRLQYQGYTADKKIGKSKMLAEEVRPTCQINFWNPGRGFRIHMGWHVCFILLFW